MRQPPNSVFLFFSFFFFHGSVPMLGFCFPFAGLKVSALISFFTSLWMCLLECVTSLLLQQHSVCSHGNHCDVISKRISVPRQQCKLRVTGLRRGGDSETRLV